MSNDEFPINSAQSMINVIREVGMIPFWAKFVEDDTDSPTLPDCSPEESRQILIDHLTSLFPEGRDKFGKLI